MNHFDNYLYEELFKYLHLRSIINLTHNEYVNNIMGQIKEHALKEIYGFGLTQKDNCSFIDNGLDIIICNDIIKNAQLSFINACNFEELDVAKLLLVLYTEIDIHLNCDNVFMRSCCNGQLEVAKWLYSLDGKINIHDSYEYAFRFSCSNGHLDVAKWLYSLDGPTYDASPCDGDVQSTSHQRGKINIHIDNDDAFRFSCSNGHLDVAKWLYSLDMDYYDTHLSECVEKLIMYWK